MCFLVCPELVVSSTRRQESLQFLLYLVRAYRKGEIGFIYWDSHGSLRIYSCMLNCQLLMNSVIWCVYTFYDAFSTMLFLKRVLIYTLIRRKNFIYKSVFLIILLPTWARQFMDVKVFFFIYEWFYPFNSVIIYVKFYLFNSVMKIYLSVI